MTTPQMVRGLLLRGARKSKDDFAHLCELVTSTDKSVSEVAQGSISTFLQAPQPNDSVDYVVKVRWSYGGMDLTA